MSMWGVALDPEKQAQARQYARIRRRLWLADTLFGGLFLLAWLVFGWAKALASWLKTYTSNQWPLVLGFAVVFGGILLVLDLPLNYYSSFVLPHRFGQSTQDFEGWVVDQLKSWAISAPLGLILLELVYLALRLAGGWWWLWTGAGMLVFTVLLSNLAPILIMPPFNKLSLWARNMPNWPSVPTPGCAACSSSTCPNVFGVRHS
jgi:STE24 endopeptidase